VKVLVACECSGRVRDAFTALGHDAWSCDLLPSDTPGNHLQCDVLTVLDRDWDLMIAHPPCRYLCNSGVRWLSEREGRWELMREGAEFFRRLLHADIPQRCIENSIMHKYAAELVGRRQDQVIQPWMFGDGETKATCLWLEGLPKLKPTKIVDGRKPTVHRMPPGPEREKLRSLTYPGIAAAMADQWGGDCFTHSP
jgi:hypothetical protein